MLISWIYILLGLVTLTVGAECLVRGAAGLAARLGISSLIIGLTVVAFGTSSPELAVSVFAAVRGDSDIAVGNVVGSNIFNVFMILGLAAIIAPLIVQPRMVRLDVPMVIGVSAALWTLSIDGEIGRIESALLAVGLVVYIAWTVATARRERAFRPQGDPTEAEEEAEQLADRRTSPWLLGSLVIIGLVLCIVGSRFFVDGSVRIARALGVSELVIGLTIVAAGTSLPELATSVLAAIRGERDIAVGNILGSNLFNILGVLGISGMISPLAVADQALRLDIPVMLAAAVACVPVFITGARISRWEGALFLMLYVVYTAYLVLDATESPLAGPFGWVAIAGVTPAVVLALVLSMIMSRRPRA